MSLQPDPEDSHPLPAIAEFLSPFSGVPRPTPSSGTAASSLRRHQEQHPPPQPAKLPVVWMGHEDVLEVVDRGWRGWREGGGEGRKGQ